jgi:hypothetical protein
MPNLIIDPEFKKLIPPLAPDEYQQLEQNIINDGCLHELIVWDDMIIDGHNRYEICTKHKIPFKIKNWYFDDRGEAKEWIIRNQFGRRNISDYQRSALALELKEIIAAKAKGNQRAAGGAVPKKSAEAIETREEIAKTAGVSHDTIRKVEIIEEKAPEPIKEMARNNIVSINKAHDFTRAIEAMPEPEKKEVIQKVEEIGKTAVNAVVKGIKLTPENIKKLEEGNKHDDFVCRIKKTYIDIIAKAATLVVDDERISAFLEDEQVDFVDRHLRLIDDGISRLTAVKNKIQNRMRPQAMKGR